MQLGGTDVSGRHMNDGGRPLRLMHVSAYGVFFSLFASAALCSTAEIERDIFKAMHFENLETMGPDQRLRLVDTAIAYWKSFDDRIARNDPAQEAWLKGEFSSQDQARLGGALASPIYARSQLVDLGKRCIAIFESLKTAVGGDKVLELYLWIKSTQCYSGEFTGEYLQRVGLSDGRADGSFKMTTFPMMLNVITGKLSNSIVAP